MIRGFLVVVLLAGCGGSATTDDEDYLDQYGGVAAVYAEIARETSCAVLQESFDRAAENNESAESGSAEQDWTLGYMTAAEDRRQAIGC